MAMVNVGIVRVRMFKPLVPMRVNVRLARWVIRRVVMLVMLVMHVFMLVRHWFVYVAMFVCFCDV
jgi:hypothetical protein